jgi:hypothetical protein
MKKDMLSKILVIGIIFLFIGVGFQPVFANYNDIINNEKKQLGNKTTVITNPVFPRGVTFIKIIGDEAHGEEGFHVQQTTDGGYIIVGDINYDIWLVKTDSVGNIVWDKTFGGTDGDHGRCVQQTTDGGYIITGFTESYGAGEFDVWLIKTDSVGNKIWDKMFGGGDDEFAYNVQQASDGGYIIVGSTRSFGYGNGYSDFWLIKTDNAGNKMWDKTFGGEDSDYGRCVQQTSDGGYIITGTTSSFDAIGYDVWLIKTDSNGDKVWDRLFGREHSDSGNYVQQTSDGGYIITGTSYSDDVNGFDVWLIKTDSNGNKMWDKIFGREQFDEGHCVQQTDDGGYIITGEFYYSAHSFYPEVWLIKTDSNGKKMWSSYFGGYGDCWGKCVQQTTDGGYIIVGFAQYYEGDGDAFLIKTNENGRSRTIAETGNMLLLRLLDRFPVLERLLDVWRSFIE